MPQAAGLAGRRILLTGSAGFVAPYVVDCLKGGSSAPLEILATARKAGSLAGIGPVSALDITDEQEVNRVVSAFRPDAIVHLAGISDIAAAQAAPREAWEINLHGTLHLARATLAHAPEATFLFAGSCQVYGSTALGGHPLSEEDLLAPNGEYAATKAAADLALGMLARRGLRCVRMRPFNHIGRGQSAAFAIPSFASQIAKIERGLQAPVIKVGNLEAERDFLDVRDVAAAYAMACLPGSPLKPGVILNLASGRAIRMRTILEKLIAMTGQTIEIEVDAARWRENEIPRLVGNAELAASLLGWKPQHSIEETLRDVLDEQRARVA
ncbi:MAG: GDP-mannose 4,6-dehydratase [Proteobacteria bacterium]|nr:GDP-mannose 4,6-dehydratase [Pseudomonadota bacterium]